MWLLKLSRFCQDFVYNDIRSIHMNRFGRHKIRRVTVQTCPYRKLSCQTGDSPVAFPTTKNDLISLKVSGGRELCVRRLHIEDFSRLKEAYNLVQDCVLRGDNTGTYEYPHLEHFLHIVKFSDTFLFYSKSTNQNGQEGVAVYPIACNDKPSRQYCSEKNNTLSSTKAEENTQMIQNKSLKAVVVIESKINGISRSLIPCNAHHVYFMNEDLTEEERRSLVHYTVKVTHELDQGYTACTACVFFPCISWLNILKEEGFNIVGCVHKAGRLSTVNGYISSYNLYRGSHDRKPLPKPDMEQIRRRADDIADSLEGLNPSPTYRRTIPNLPMDYKLNDGTPVIVRSLREDEHEKFYQLFCRAGYGWDEFPTLNFFKKIIIDHGYGLVVELKDSSIKTSSSMSDTCRLTSTESNTDSGRWLCAGIISDSGYSRCYDLPEGEHQQLCDMFYASGGPEFDGRKFGSEIVRNLMLPMAVDLGYTGKHGDNCIHNIPSIRISVWPSGAVITGVIPNAIYFTDHLWTDVIMTYKPLEHVPGFKTIFEGKLSPSNPVA